MPSKMLFLYGVPIFVGCCAILWHYWDSFKKPSKPRRIRKKKIFISADCWLAVFELLPPRQLGLGIALISNRFDYYVQEHFKTRRWSFGFVQIWRRKKKTNGTQQMEIVNYDGKELPIPQKALPKNVLGFKSISIKYIDQNAIAFLQRFRQLFVSCPINLVINTGNDRHILESFLRNIWPIIAKNICAIQLPQYAFSHLRQTVPSILNYYPSLRVVNSNYADGFFTEFPADDSAMASDGQSLAKWLFTPLPDNVPKVFKCWWKFNDGNLSPSIEAFKSAFANASSSANFIVVIWRPRLGDIVEPFDQTNELTREQLTFKWISDFGHYVLIRCPIVRDTDKWAKWEKEAIDWQFYDQWNRIDICRPI